MPTKTHSHTKLSKRSYKPKLSAIGLAALLASGSMAARAVDFTVQIGAFGVAPKPSFTQDAADYGEVMVTKGDDGVTRVSIGRYSTKSDARNALARLQIAGYTDAYVTNLSPGMSAAATAQQPFPKPAQQAPSTPQKSTTPSAPARTLTNTAGSTASSQRLPSGRQIVPPKQPVAKQPAVMKKGDAAKAGRFRLRTHDTQSGQTKDVELVPIVTKTRNGRAAPGTPGQSSSGGQSTGVVAGMGVNDIPAELRNKLVYLDGVPHIKEGDQFIPLNDAIDGKP